MRYFLFSDIHSNLEALQIVFRDMSRNFRFNASKDKIILLGDIIGYYANPNEVLDFIWPKSHIQVRGNHELYVDYFLNRDYSRLNQISNEAGKAIAWNAKLLTSENKERIRSLVSREGFFKWKNMFFSHSYPGSESYVESAQDACEFLLNSMFRGFVGFVGHSHVPQVYSLQGNSISGGQISFSEREPHLFKNGKFTDSKGRMAFSCNLGECSSSLVVVPSVGQPRDGLSYAGYAMFDSSSRDLKVVRLKYNFRVTQEKIRKGGLPESLASRLGYGM